MRESASIPLNHYIDRIFAHEDALLQRVRAKGDALVPGMQISAGEGKMLAVFAQMIQAKRVLEVGTFVGYSALWMAGAMGAEGVVDTLEANPTNAAIAREHFDASAYARNIILHEGMALATLERLKEAHDNANIAPYDMVFIDAAKSEYDDYLALCTPLLRDGGVMVGDNTLLFGHMIDAPKKEVSDAAIRAMASFNAALGGELHYSGVMLPTEEGLTIGVKLPQSCNKRSVS